MNKRFGIRPAQASEAPVLSALGIRSKSHWGYPEEQMSIFRRELTLTEEELDAKQAHVLETESSIAGYYTLLRRNKESLELEHLFIEPSKFGQGYGSQLFKHACDLAKTMDYRTLIIQSDPHAAGFYKALGVPLIREIPSSIPGRVIPYFELDIEHRMTRQKK